MSVIREESFEMFKKIEERKINTKKQLFKI